MEEEIVKDSNRTPKNPKKVKAGKASARGRKKGEMPQLDISTIYNGLQSIAGLVATGFTLYHGWKFFLEVRADSWGATQGAVHDPYPPKSEEVGELEGSRIQSKTKDEEVGEPATPSLPRKSSRKSAIIF